MVNLTHHSYFNLNNGDGTIGDHLVRINSGTILEQDDNFKNPKLKLFAAYAFGDEVKTSMEFALGQGLVGQVALEKERILLSNVPRNYTKIGSGLGKASPLNLIVLPVLFEKEIKAVIELASFDTFSETHLDFLSQLTESIGIVLNTIEANTRTESLLVQSQSLTDELRRTNEELHPIYLRYLLRAPHVLLPTRRPAIVPPLY